MINAHALLSPSGAAGWMACVGKPAMEKGMPDDSNEYSDEGTCAHAVAAMCWTESLPASAYVGRRIDLNEHKTYEFREDMAEPVQAYIDAIHAQVQSYKVMGATSVEVMIEQRVPIGHITGEEGAEGTADVVMVVLFRNGKTLIEVRDLKFGRGIEVDAKENEQGMFYGLGAAEKFSAITQFDHVNIVIHQPRLRDKPSEWMLPMEELVAFGHKASGRAKTALIAYEFSDNWVSQPEKHGEYLRAGPHCKKTFCKARATCPALANFVEDTVLDTFESMAEVAVGAKEPHALPPIPEAPADLSIKLHAVDIIEDWCKAIRAKADALLNAGTAIPGWKLVEGKQGNRGWDDANAVEKEMKGMRIKQADMYTFNLKSPAQLEKIAPRYDKDGALKEKQPDSVVLRPKHWEDIAKHIRREAGKKHVAPESDPRPAIIIGPVADAFDSAPPADGSDLV